MFQWLTRCAWQVSASAPLLPSVTWTRLQRRGVRCVRGCRRPMTSRRSLRRARLRPRRRLLQRRRARRRLWSRRLWLRGVLLQRRNRRRRRALLCRRRRRVAPRASVWPSRLRCAPRFSLRHLLSYQPHDPFPPLRCAAFPSRSPPAHTAAAPPPPRPAARAALRPTSHRARGLADSRHLIAERCLRAGFAARAAA